jgi:hypothetical protein
MPRFLSEQQFEVLSAVVDRLIPPDESPGAREAGVPQYIDELLGAFTFDPPRIWAGGPFSGRYGGTNGFERFHSLTALEELAWRTRIEGSLGIPERERLGTVVGLQERYVEGLAALGPDFVSLSAVEQEMRLREHDDFAQIVYGHACEGMYAAPEYGGNRGLVGWEYIGYLGDVQPRGYTDAEVSGP